MDGFLASGLRLQALGESKSIRQRIDAGELWTLLQAVAYVASLDPQLVSLIAEWEDEERSPNRPVQLSAAVRDRLKNELTDRKGSGKATSFELAQVTLLDGMNRGKIIGHVNGQVTLFTGMNLRSFTYGQTYVGVEPAPNDGKWAWNFVLLYRESVETFVSQDGHQSTKHDVSSDEARENVKSVTLALFRERLVQGVTERAQGAEAGAIWQAWRGRVKRPAERRVYESLAGIHKLLLFRAGKLDPESAVSVIEKIEKTIGDFNPYDLLPRNHAIGKLARQMETSDAARPFYRGPDHRRAA